MEHSIDFNLFNTVEWIDIITEDESEKLTKKFEVIGDRFWKSLSNLDRKQLEKLK